MLEKEDGPIKHYRLICNICKKKTKRYAYELHFSEKEFPGWKQVVSKERYGEYDHFCPKCSGNPEPDKITTIIPNNEDTVDHEDAGVHLERISTNEIKISIIPGVEITFISDTPIRVEQEDK